MLDYGALNKLEKQYGNISLVPEDNPLLSKLRKSAIGNEDDPQTKHPIISGNISHDDVVEIQYYWDHGVHNARKIGRLMGRDNKWVTMRLEVMGLSTIKRKRLSNAERRRHYRNGSEKAIEHVESDKVAYIPALPMHRKHIITLGDGDDD